MVTSGCLYFLEKFDELSKSVAIGEIEVFYRPEWTEVINLKMNLKYFQIQKWMLEADRAEKIDEKNVVICVVFIFPSWVMILKLSKKCIFSILCWPQQKSLGMLKQFTYMHLKRLVMRFQKMLLFTMLWLHVLKILVFEIEELC